MRRFVSLTAASSAAAACLLLAPCALRADPPGAAAPPTAPKPLEGDYVIPNFRFASGEALPELRLHFTTIGKPRHDEHGHVTNAVLILHGTGGSGHSFLVDRFSGVLFNKGQLLDTNRYYVILPDGIGHGDSSKPSDGLHMRFPQYTYADMVSAQYALLTQGLHVDHLRLVHRHLHGLHAHLALAGELSGLHGRGSCRSPAFRCRSPAATACGATWSWIRSAPTRNGCRASTAASR